MSVHLSLLFPLKVFSQWLPFVVTLLIPFCRDGDTAMGQGDGEQQGDADGSHVTQTAPALLWKPERVAADLKLSRQLIEKLDQEKGIISNPLIAADELNGTPTGSNHIFASCCAFRRFES